MFCSSQFAWLDTTWAQFRQGLSFLGGFGSVAQSFATICSLVLRSAREEVTAGNSSGTLSVIPNLG